MFKRIIHSFKQVYNDEHFMAGVYWVENLVAKVLAIALIAVIFVSVIDLIVLLTKDLIDSKPLNFFGYTLLELFGLFLNILIALELLENITSYIRKHVVKIELVFITALIAVARKIIIFDPSKLTQIDLIGLGVACLCLSTSYWLVRQMKRRENR